MTRCAARALGSARRPRPSVRPARAFRPSDSAPVIRASIWRAVQSSRSAGRHGARGPRRRARRPGPTPPAFISVVFAVARRAWACRRARGGRQDGHQPPLGARAAAAALRTPVRRKRALAPLFLFSFPGFGPICRYRRAARAALEEAFAGSVGHASTSLRGLNPRSSGCFSDGCFAS